MEGKVCGDICVNLLSDGIFVIILVLITGGFSAITRKKLKKFFGVKNTNSLLIYVSNLEIVKGGAKGIDGKAYSYAGDAVPLREIEVANQIKKLFTFTIQPLNDIAYSLKNVNFGDALVEITSSPNNISRIDSKNSIISLGLPPYNTVSKIIEQSHHNIVHYRNSSVTPSEGNPEEAFFPPSGVQTNPNLQTQDQHRYMSAGTALPSPNIVDASVSDNFVAENLSQTSPGNQIGEITIDGNENLYSKTTYGFIERIINKDEDDCTYFYIAGISEQATVGAVQYLSKKWKHLYKKYKDTKSFLIILNISPKDSSKATVEFEKEI